MSARPDVDMPPLRSMVGRIASQVVEGTLVPALIFWSMLHLTGLVWALFAGLAWCYLAIVRRWAQGVALPTVLVVGALLFTTRTGVALAFHSTFIYLLTPTINAFVLAAVFAGSALVRRPITERFAQDFVGLPAHVTALAKVHSALRRLSLVWALVNIVNGGVALQLLAANHVDGVMLARSVMTPVLSALAVVCCVLMGRKALHAEGIHLHLRWRDAPAT
ncbi:MAG: Intracellular septation protein [Frankiales bacterium]|nr:Intracellular septation protein [Frankiales bacterium]